MASTPRILFVCLGNICRSPLAEAAFRAAAEESGLAVEVDSAGTGDWHAGSPPDRRAIAVAAAHGIDIAGYRARQVTDEDFTRFDSIFALDVNNLRDLAQHAPPGSTADLDLLLDCVPGRAGESVADPYYGNDAGFAQTWADVSLAAEALVARLKG